MNDIQSHSESHGLFGGKRYGFNGKEIDTEGMGGGASTYDYGFRIYNAGLGRFLSTDPLSKEYPWYTPYQFAGNRPINSIDLDGLEERTIIAYWQEHEDCSVQLCVFTRDSPDNPGELGHGVLLMALNVDNKDFYAQYRAPVEVNAIADQSIISLFADKFVSFFDPKGGFEFSSEGGSLSSARFGNGETIEGMDILLQALGGMHSAASLNGNPLLTSSEIGAEEFDQGFDFILGRISDLIDTTEALSDLSKGDNGSRGIDSSTESPSINIKEYIITVHPGGSTTQTKYHRGINSDSLETLKKEEGTVKSGGSHTTKYYEEEK